VGQEGEADRGGRSSSSTSPTAKVGAVTEVDAAEYDRLHCTAEPTFAGSDSVVMTDTVATTPSTAARAERGLG